MNIKDFAHSLLNSSLRLPMKDRGGPECVVRAVRAWHTRTVYYGTAVYVPFTVYCTNGLQCSRYKQTAPGKIFQPYFLLATMQPILTEQ